MKYKYQFSNEENTIDIDEKWAAILSELDRADLANDKKETRRHYHFEYCNYEGDDFIDTKGTVDSIFDDKSMEEELHIAIAKLKPKQQELIYAIYFEGVSVNDYAAKEGVDQSAVSHRLETAKNNLKKLL